MLNATLSGSMAVVTGGTAGIGRACAEALLAAGAAGVLINGRNRERAENARREIQERYPIARVAVATGDVARPETAEAVMAEAMAQLGRIDILVNSTGGNDLPKLLYRTALDGDPRHPASAACSPSSSAARRRCRTCAPPAAAPSSTSPPTPPSCRRRAKA